MPDSLHEFLTGNPNALLFLILGLGYAIGKTKIKGFELGSVSGVLFVALFFGHFGYEMDPVVQSLGFMLFIFSVGFQAGPRFFAVLKQDGLRYLCLALVIGVTGFVLAVVLSRLFGLAPGSAAGMLAGGLTSSPTLAAAQEAVRAGQVPAPDGLTADAVMTNVTTSYAITYIFGLVGLILLVRLIPKFTGVDLRAEAARLAQADKGSLEDAVQGFGSIVARAYRVTKPDLTGVPLGDIKQRMPGRASLVKLRRDGEFIEVNDDTCIELGDEIGIVGHLDMFVEDAAERVGVEVADPALLESAIESCRVVVTQKSVKGAVLDPITVARKHGVFIAHLKRSGLDVPLTGAVELMPGDVLHVTGPQERIDRAAEQVGHVERDYQETDLVALAFGIVIGSFVGALAITVGGVSIGLGSAGGLLSAGLVIGYLRALHPTFGRMPSAARWVFMELGLLMFMAGVGLRAGTNIIETLAISGPVLFASGILVTSVPVVVGYAFGRKVLGINPVLLLGGITGSMTSGASLSMVLREAGNSMPALGYTGAYAFANILLTIAGSVILLL